MRVMASVRISLLSKPNIVLCVSTLHVSLCYEYILYFTRGFNLQNIVLFLKAYLMMTEIEFCPYTGTNAESQ